MLAREIKWYLKNLFFSPEYPIFIFVFLFVYLNSGHVSMSSEKGNFLYLSKSFFGTNGVFSHDFLVMVFVGYIAIVLFTYPLESGLSFFEFSLPSTKDRIFIAKYLSGIIYIFLTLGFAETLSIFIKTNEIFGFDTPYPYLHLLSILLDITYVFSLFVLFGIVFKKTAGVIVGILFLFLLEEFLIHPLKILLPPIIYGSSLFSIGDFLNVYRYELPIAVFLGMFAYILYRRVEI